MKLYGALFQTFTFSSFLVYLLVAIIKIWVLSPAKNYIFPITAGISFYSCIIVYFEKDLTAASIIMGRLVVSTSILVPFIPFGNFYLVLCILLSVLQRTLILRKKVTVGTDKWKTVCILLSIIISISNLAIVVHGAGKNGLIGFPPNLLKSVPSLEKWVPRSRLLLLFSVPSGLSCIAIMGVLLTVKPITDFEKANYTAADLLIAF